MNSLERRATGALAAVYALRMFGLFALVPVLAPHAATLPGATPLLLGLAVGAYGLTQALLQIPFGALSDRLGRRPVITFGLLVFAAGSLLTGAADSAPMLVAGRALQGAGAVAATLMALLADHTREQQRTRAMAIVGMSIGAAYLVALPAGPALATLLGVDGLLYLIAALALAALVLLWATVPAPAARLRHADTQARPREIAALLRRPELLRLDLSVLALHALMTAVFVALPLELAAQGVGAGAQARLYLPVVLLSVLPMFPLILLAERGGRMREVFLGCVLLLGLAQGGLLLAGHTLLVVGAGLLAFFVAFNVLEAVLPSLISRLAPVAHKGSALGAYSTSQFLGAFLGGVLGGTVHGWGGLAAVLAVNALIVALWLPAVWRVQAPTHLRTRSVTVGPVSAAAAPALASQLLGLRGVTEAEIVAAEGVAYLKVDARQFDPAVLDAYLRERPAAG